MAWNARPRRWCGCSPVRPRARHSCGSVRHEGRATRGLGVCRPEVRDVPESLLGPGEVLLRLTTARALSFRSAPDAPPDGTVDYALPFTLGHEVAGTVVELGKIEVGQSVLVYGPWGLWRLPAVQPRSRAPEMEVAGRMAAAGSRLGASEETAVDQPRSAVD